MRQHQGSEVFRTEQLLGRALEPDEADEIIQYGKGRELAHLVNDPGWLVALEMLRGYVESATRSLVGLPPGHPDVVAAHAAASAVTDLYTKFIQDVDQAVNQEPPDVLRRRAPSAGPIESL
jgi:hypothetical protein